MADFMVYYRNYQRDIQAGGLSSEIDWHTSHEPTFEVVKPGDDIWVIIWEENAGWRLLQRIRVKSKEVDPERGSFEVQEYGRLHIIGDPATSKRFDPAAQQDLEPILGQFTFATGIGLGASGRQIGNKFQAPRALSESDAKLLREYEAGM